MDGEQFMLILSAVNTIGVMIIGLVTWSNKRAAREAVRASDIRELKASFDKLERKVTASPTVESLQLLEARLKLEINEAETRARHDAVDRVNEKFTRVASIDSVAALAQRVESLEGDRQ